MITSERTKELVTAVNKLGQQPAFKMYGDLSVCPYCQNSDYNFVNFPHRLDCPWMRVQSAIDILLVHGDGA